MNSVQKIMLQQKIPITDYVFHNRADCNYLIKRKYTVYTNSVIKYVIETIVVVFSLFPVFSLAYIHSVLNQGLNNEHEMSHFAKHEGVALTI